MDATRKTPANVVVTETDRGDRRARNAARAVGGFLTAFLALNTYWGLGGLWGVAWVLGCDCTVPLAAVWVQETAVVTGIGIVLGRAGIWRPGLPSWIFSIGAWAMTASFALVGLQNMLGDNTTQARFVFAPAALALSALCAVVAHGRRAGTNQPPAPRPRRGFGQRDRADILTRRATTVAAGTAIRPIAPPAWARKAAMLTVLTTVPSGLWRMSMAVGVPVGVDPTSGASTTGSRHGARPTSSASPSCSRASPRSPWDSSGPGARSYRGGFRSSAAGTSHRWRR